MLLDFTLFGSRPYDANSGITIDIGWIMTSNLNWYSVVLKLLQNDKNPVLLKAWPEVLQGVQQIRITFPNVKGVLRVHLELWCTNVNSPIEPVLCSQSPPFILSPAPPTPVFLPGLDPISPEFTLPPDRLSPSETIPPSSSTSAEMPAAAIVGLVIMGIVILAAAYFIVWKQCRRSEAGPGIHQRLCDALSPGPRDNDHSSSIQGSSPIKEISNPCIDVPWVPQFEPKSFPSEHAPRVQDRTMVPGKAHRNGVMMPPSPALRVPPSLPVPPRRLPRAAEPRRPRMPRAVILPDLHDSASRTMFPPTAGEQRVPSRQYKRVFRKEEHRPERVGRETGLRLHDPKRTQGRPYDGYDRLSTAESIADITSAYLEDLLVERNESYERQDTEGRRNEVLDDYRSTCDHGRMPGVGSHWEARSTHSRRYPRAISSPPVPASSARITH
ncbi:hypothetical protein BC939DRAFT_528849 [Gamsiella multidivaricata]|uniref:uncharacterized protein n=1 Tax=Gamsiella multidivaricata TaxID=101098 RepID=UPI00221FA0C2|nr:uncharacterized protein BC939DRAFT_528849 [Gamsiella multidivaricata]KAI7823513.1 hypothetical protein BC939DRAFT_528849 [Gamsiella multidivaricata]